MKKAPISDEYYRINTSCSISRSSKRPKEQCRACYQQENSGWKAVVISGPRSLSGGTDFPRQRGVGELQMFSEISSPCRFTRSARSRPKELGKVLGSTPSSLLYWLRRGTYSRSGSWTETGLPAEAVWTKSYIPQLQIKPVANFSLIIASASGKRNSLR